MKIFMSLVFLFTVAATVTSEPMQASMAKSIADAAAKKRLDQEVKALLDVAETLIAETSYDGGYLTLVQYTHETLKILDNKKSWVNDRLRTPKCVELAEKRLKELGYTVYVNTYDEIPFTYTMFIYWYK